jgi:hypothetical protein
VSIACFDFHGVGIEVTGDSEELVEAIAGRLRHFRRERVDPVLRFTYRVAGEEHVLRPPEGTGRPVYNPPLGTVTYFDEEDVLWIDFGGRVLVHCDVRSRSVSVSANEDEYRQLWLLSRPLFTVPLIELLRREDLYNVHAAGVASGGRSVLFAGSTGSGKSTLAVALTRAGFDLLGDDMVFLQEDNGGLTARAFPDEVDVTDETASWFDELRPVAAAPLEAGWPKHRIRSEEFYSGGVTEASTPAVVIFPQVSGRHESELERIGADEALRELAPNILLTEVRTAQAHLDVLASLARTCVCYRLRTGRDFDHLVEAVRELLE